MSPLCELDEHAPRDGADGVGGEINGVSAHGVLAERDVYQAAAIQ